MNGYDQHLWQYRDRCGIDRSITIIEKVGSCFKIESLPIWNCKLLKNQQQKSIARCRNRNISQFLLKKKKQEDDSILRKEIHEYKLKRILAKKKMKLSLIITLNFSITKFEVILIIVKFYNKHHIQLI